MEIIVAMAVGLAIGALGTWILLKNRGGVPEGTRDQIRDTVQAGAAQAFQANNQAFLDLAHERFSNTIETAKSELNQRHELFQALVKPLTEDYKGLDPQIKQLIQQNTTLTAETGRLASALTNNQQVGNWGELQLRRVVELAGMTGYYDFADSRVTRRLGMAS